MWPVTQLTAAAAPVGLEEDAAGVPPLMERDREAYAYGTAMGENLLKRKKGASEYDLPPFFLSNLAKPRPHR